MTKQDSYRPGADGEPLIRITGLSRYFDEGGRRRIVLDQVSETIFRGEIIVILGRSGSGKSTLLNLLSGIDLPNGGDIEIAGQKLTRLSEHRRTLIRRRHLGFIFQFFNLVPTLTVLENLLLPLELNAVTGAEAHRRARKLLAAVELEDRRDTFPDRLSGGEQQRVAIARALIHDPDIILADEPTGNLDIETGRKIVALLDRMVRRQGKTMLMVTHSRDVIGLADRILTVREGSLFPTLLEQVP